jgi:CRP-like cAMP-binding protein
MATGSHTPVRSSKAELNRILSSLSRPAFDRLMKDFELADLDFKQEIHRPSESMPYVYFPIAGVLSLLTTLEDGTSVELGTVGNEGMVDVSVFLGLEASESQITAQIPGEALRMKAATFRHHLETEPELRIAIGAYVLELFTMVAQNNACNRAHTVGQRLARWLLMCHDRVDTDTFPITQEFMSEMLGVRRPTISTAAAALQIGGAIEYNRGMMTIRDRQRLEAATCECYRLIRARFDRLPGKVRSVHNHHNN